MIGLGEQFYQNVNSMTKNRALEVKTSMFKLYQEYFDAWRINRREALNNEFVLCARETNKNVNNERQELLSRFVYINKYGIIRLNIHGIDYKNKFLLISTDLYTQGCGGKEKGNGPNGHKCLEQIVNNLSGSTDYKIYDIASPNRVSLGLLIANGYKPFLEKDLENIKTRASESIRGELHNLLEIDGDELKMIKYYYAKTEDVFFAEEQSVRDLENVISTINKISNNL